MVLLENTDKDKKLLQVYFNKEKLKEIDDYIKDLREEPYIKIDRSKFIRKACDFYLVHRLDSAERVKKELLGISREWTEEEYQSWFFILGSAAWIRSRNDKKFDINKALIGVNLKKMNPFILWFQDYYSIGNSIGKAYKIGRGNNPS